MQRLRKNKTKFKLLTILTILVFSATAFAAGLPSGRIIPDGKVSLFKGTQKIGEYHAEAPLPDHTLLSVQGRCGVKLNNIYLVAMDKSLFSIRTEALSRTLLLEHGTVYFALASKSLAFQTPEKMISIHKVLLNASSDHGLLKGYIQVEDGTTKIGVLQGGSMVLTVDDGQPIMIKSKQELLLTQADLFDLPEEGAAEETATETTTETATETAAETAAETGTGAETAAAAGAVGGVSSTTMLIGLGVLAIGGAAAAGGGGGGGGGGEPPPASPSGL